MESNKTRQVIAATIDYGAMAYTDHDLKIRSLAFLTTAAPELLKKLNTMEIVFFRQGETCEHHSLGETIEVITMTNEAINNAILLYENTPQGARVPGAGQPSLILCLGDVAFCQAFIHMMATAKDGEAQSWGLHYIRNLTNADDDVTLWYDTDTPGKFWRDSMTEMGRTYNDRISATMAARRVRA